MTTPGAANTDSKPRRPMRGYAARHFLWSCSDDGRVATITLNRPERLNALDHAMMEDLLHDFGSAGEDPACRAIALRGAVASHRAGL